MKNKFRRSIGTNILIYFCAAVLFILILFPFYWIICTSFKETLDIYVIPPEFFPKKFDFTNYATVCIVAAPLHLPYSAS